MFSLDVNSNKYNPLCVYISDAIHLVNCWCWYHKQQMVNHSCEFRKGKKSLLQNVFDVFFNWCMVKDERWYKGTRSGDKDNFQQERSNSQVLIIKKHWFLGLFGRFLNYDAQQIPVGNLVILYLIQNPYSSQDTLLPYQNQSGMPVSSVSGCVDTGCGMTRDSSCCSVICTRLLVWILMEQVVSYLGATEFL